MNSDVEVLFLFVLLKRMKQKFKWLCDSRNRIMIIINFVVMIVRVESEETKEIDIRSGMLQGCILSPLLFNVYFEVVISEAFEGLEMGVKINEKVINNLRYADDTILAASTASDLQNIYSEQPEYTPYCFKYNHFYTSTSLIWTHL